MTTSKDPSADRPRPRRLKRSDGATTRLALLEAAGIVFAEKGFDRATAKEIAEKAGTNAAAVNYHFGGIESLYEEVLAEAHHRAVSYDLLASILDATSPVEDQLRHLFALLVGIARQPARTSWSLRVLSREMLAPTAHAQTLLETEIGPKKELLFQVISHFVGRPVNDPATARAAFAVIAPWIMMLLAGPHVMEIFPPLAPDQGDAEIIVDQMMTYTLGGLEALRRTL